jgi:hypothetical protein
MFIKFHSEGCSRNSVICKQHIFFCHILNPIFVKLLHQERFICLSYVSMVTESVKRIPVLGYFDMICCVMNFQPKSVVLGWKVRNVRGEADVLFVQRVSASFKSGVNPELIKVTSNLSFSLHIGHTCLWDFNWGNFCTCALPFA